MNDHYEAKIEHGKFLAKEVRNHINRWIIERGDEPERLVLPGYAIAAIAAYYRQEGEGMVGTLYGIDFVPLESSLVIGSWVTE